MSMAEIIGMARTMAVSRFREAGLGLVEHRFLAETDPTS